MKDIILTGPKHSGKTSAGKVLASLCSCDFIDIDELISQRTGRSPRQLFIKGRAAFQRAEIEALAAVMDTNGARVRRREIIAGRDRVGRQVGVVNKDRAKWRVIATGGGIIDNRRALSVLKKSGAVIVYLDIPAETAWDRIAAKGELPPFLRTKNPRETHRVLHERRAMAYLKNAGIVIKAKGKSPQEVAAEIHSKLN